jgi:dihydroxy-acid dehydratase
MAPLGAAQARWLHGLWAGAAALAGLAWLRTGDIIRIDLNSGRCDMLVDKGAIEARKAGGLPQVPPSETPWQVIYRATVSQLDRGAVIEEAVDFRGIGHGVPRHNH